MAVVTVLLRPIECQRSITLHKGSSLSKVAGGARQFFALRVLDDKKSVRRQQRIASEAVQERFVKVLSLVRRIQKRDVERSVENVERFDEIHLKNLEPPLDPE